MRYYIVDYNGTVWGDFNDYETALARFETYTIEEVESNELEIIEGI